MELKVAVPSSSANEELNDASMSSEDEEIVDPLSSAREELSHCRQQFLVAVSYPRMDPLEYVMFGKVYRIGGEESSAESNTLAAYAFVPWASYALTRRCEHLHGF
uniref:Uncharacterized protein n=1 Tax=Parascaris univalens TaxID=6257 RepID=A0A914ZMM9_PARUN